MPKPVYWKPKYATRSMRHRAWVRQEAYAKGCGAGLELIGESPNGWSIADLDLIGGYAAALAVEGTAPVRIETSPI